VLKRFTDLEGFQNLASELTSSRTQMNSGEEARKAAPYFTAAIDSAYGLSIGEITFLM
jgi:hypothetical protein